MAASLANLRETPDRFLTEQEAAEATMRSVRSLQRDRMLDQGIPFYKLGGKVAYKAGDVLTWIEGCRREPAGVS